jgi:kanamycin kinase
VIAGVPSATVPVPPAIAAFAGAGSLRPVWRNELGGLTFEITAPSGRRFAKWSPAGSGLDLRREAARLRWAADFITVPKVLAEGADETGAWIVTMGIDGESAVAPRWRAEPRSAVVAIGRGLRLLHERLPVEGCPFSWSVSDRLARLRPGADPTNRLSDPPPVDRLVVCHGDACAPNTLLDEQGDCAGHVDLGALGVADRWADLAVATWSLDWNYGPGWQPVLLDAYGVDADTERIAYYRLLWDLTS